jgi:hypothetical protein
MVVENGGTAGRAGFWLEEIRGYRLSVIQFQRQRLEDEIAFIGNIDACGARGRKA